MSHARRGLFLPLLLAACAGAPGQPSIPSPAECRSGVVGSPLARSGDIEEANPGGLTLVEWRTPEEPAARDELDRWCRGVGQPVLFEPTAEPVGEATDRVAIVVWNTHVGAGRLDELVADLRSGRLAAEPVSDFVLLLQEVYQVRGDSPEPPPAELEGGDRIAHGSERRLGSIDALASRLGLHLLYVPSMSNGRPGQAELSEDRGNAILSTLPLDGLEALELPVQRQRRVAISATVRGASRSGASWSLRLVNVHLDHRSPWGRILRSFGADRAVQAERLIAAFRGEDRVAVGGDFNTWFGGLDEPAIRLMRSEFPRPVDLPDRGTVSAPAFLSDLVLDHLFFRVPEEWSVGYEIVPDMYGSDHRPLIGWIDFGAGDRRAAGRWP